MTTSESDNKGVEEPVPMEVTGEADTAADATEETTQMEETPEKAEPDVPPPPPILGLDIGTWECCVAKFAPGKGMPEIQSNNLSLQETRNVVSFVDDDRFVGEEAVSQFTAHPAASVCGIGHLLGCTSDQVKDSAVFLPYSVVAADSGAGVQVTFRGEERVFCAEHVYAMMARKLTSFAALNEEEGPAQCVLTVPCSAALDGRKLRAYLDAARIAQLDVKRVITTTTAAAVQYGVSRLKAPEEETVGVFVDVGHSNTNVQVVAYNKDALKVLSVAHSSAIGGQTFDGRLMDIVVNTIKTKYKLDVSSNKKAQARLWKEVERKKRTLSTTPHAMLEIPCLMNDVDVQIKVTREEFEQATQDVANDIKAVVEKALADSGKTVEEMAVVEVMGGATRIPVVAAAVSASLGGKDLGHHLDSAHCVADGAAMLGGSLHAAFGLEYAVDDAVTMAEAAAGLDDAAITALIEQEERLAAADAERAQAADLRNNLESYIYETKDLIGGAAAALVTEEERTQIRALLNTAEDSLYDYDGKPLADVQAFVDQVMNDVSAASGGLAKYRAEKAEQAAKEAKEAEEKRQQYMEQAANKAPRERPLEGMTKNQRIEFSKKRKQQGTVLFKEFGYADASSRYIEAVGALASIEDMGLTEEQEAEVKELRISCHLNIAACSLKLKNWKRAQDNCEKVLKMDETNSKGLYRLGQALSALRKWDDAIKTLKRGVEADPENAAMAKELAAAEKGKKAEKAREKKMYGKMFG